jgi:hypothetical protein
MLVRVERIERRKRAFKYECILRHPDIAKSFYSRRLRLDEYTAWLINKDVDVVIEHGLKVLNGVESKVLIVFFPCYGQVLVEERMLPQSNTPSISETAEIPKHFRKA